MKPTQSPPSIVPADAPGRRGEGVLREAAKAEAETEEQAFYAAQEVAFADLRAYHASRPRRKR